MFCRPHAPTETQGAGLKTLGGKPFIVTETGATFHLALTVPSLAPVPEGPGRASIKRVWWREFLNSTFLELYPKLKAVSTFEFIKFEEETWRDFTSMGDNGSGMNSPLGNDGGPRAGPVLEALKADMADPIINRQIRWAQSVSKASNGTLVNHQSGKTNSRNAGIQTHDGSGSLFWGTVLASLAFLF